MDYERKAGNIAQNTYLLKLSAQEWTDRGREYVANVSGVQIFVIFTFSGRIFRRGGGIWRGVRAAAITPFTN